MTIDIEQQREHRMRFEDMAQKIGVASLAEIITLRISAERIKGAYKTDRHLNNIPLSEWDAFNWSIRPLAQRAGYTSWPLSYTVCVAKHVAVCHIAKIEAELALLATVEICEPVADVEREAAKFGAEVSK